MAIVKCPTCSQSGDQTAPAKYQSEKYGKGNRVANPSKAKDGKLQYGCTVCGNYTASSDLSEKKP